MNTIRWIERAEYILKNIKASGDSGRTVISLCHTRREMDVLATFINIGVIAFNKEQDRVSIVQSERENLDRFWN